MATNNKVPYVYDDKLSDFLTNKKEKKRNIPKSSTVLLFTYNY